MSHSSRQKLFVKELRKHLPDSIEVWIDEHQLVAGDDLDSTLQRTISVDADFFVLVIDRDSVQSGWVRKELEWARRRELEERRSYVIPLVLEREAWDAFDHSIIGERKFVSCTEFTDSAIQNCAADLVSELFSWLCNAHFGGERDESGAGTTLSVLEEAETLSKSIAEKVRLLVYPYREANPLPLDELLSMLHEQNLLNDMSVFNFVRLIGRLKSQNDLTGLVSDGERIWVKQEHHAWKKAIYVDAKKRIASNAIGQIESGMTIALDSGSSTLEIAKQLSDGLRMHRWQRLTVVTNSVPATTELLASASELGLEDRNDTITVYMVSGRVRPNSLAVVHDETTMGTSPGGFATMLERIGGADIGFVGTNGLYQEQGFAVHNPFEVPSKSAIIEHSRDPVIVADTSKFRIQEQRCFADFSSKLRILTAGRADDPGYPEFADLAERHGMAITLV